MIGWCRDHGWVPGFLSAPRYAGESRDPEATGNLWCSRCGLGLAEVLERWKEKR